MNESGRVDILGGLLAINAKAAGNTEQKNASSVELGAVKGPGVGFGAIFADVGEEAPPINVLSLLRGEYAKAPPIAEALPGTKDTAEAAADAPADSAVLSTLKTALRQETDPINLVKLSDVPARSDHAGARGDRALFIEESIAVRNQAFNRVPAETHTAYDFSKDDILADQFEFEALPAEAVAPARLIAFDKRLSAPLATVKLETAPVGEQITPEQKSLLGFDKRSVAPFATVKLEAAPVGEARTPVNEQLQGVGKLSPAPLATVKLEAAPVGRTITPAPFDVAVTSQAQYQRLALGNAVDTAATATRAVAQDSVRTVDTAAVELIARPQQKFPEFDVPSDRISQWRAEPRAQAPGPLSANQTPLSSYFNAMPLAHVAVSTTPPTPGLGEGATLFDADFSFDPAISLQPASSRIGSGASIIAAPNTQSFVNMTGVLPQIQAAIGARNGRDFVELRLDPPDLGRIRIDFNVEGAETLKAVIGAERAETLDHLKRNIADLEQQLKQAGFGSVSFEFLAGGGRNFSQEDAQSPFAELEDQTEVSQTASHNTIYLSLRENAQLDLLV